MIIEVDMQVFTARRLGPVTGVADELGADTLAARPGGNRSGNSERLLNAAEEIFVRDGYEAAQLDEIAATAGRSKGAVMHLKTTSAAERPAVTPEL